MTTKFSLRGRFLVRTTHEFGHSEFCRYFNALGEPEGLSRDDWREAIEAAIFEHHEDVIDTRSGLLSQEWLFDVDGFPDGDPMYRRGLREYPLGILMRKGETRAPVSWEERVMEHVLFTINELLEGASYFSVDAFSNDGMPYVEHVYLHSPGYDDAEADWHFKDEGEDLISFLFWLQRCVVEAYDIEGTYQPELIGKNVAEHVRNGTAPHFEEHVFRAAQAAIRLAQGTGFGCYTRLYDAQVHALRPVPLIREWETIAGDIAFILYAERT